MKETKKFDPNKEVRKAHKEQPGANYAIELKLSAEEADNFPYQSDWEVDGNKYRVVARLKVDDGILTEPGVLVQLKRVYW